MHASIGIVLILLMSPPAAPTRRAFPDVQIFINVSCSPESDPPTGGCRAGMGEKGTLKCGKDSAVCEVSWNWIRTEAGADYYEVTGRFPVSEYETRGEKKQVRYEGSKVPLWEDEARRIWMLPSENKR